MVFTTKKVFISTCFAWVSNRVFKVLFLFVLPFCLMGTVQGQSSSLFESDEIITLNLIGDLKSVFEDRGDDPQYHPVNIQYTTGQNTFDIPIKIKSRGHFRKSKYNCDYPPILLNFKKMETPKNSIFADQNKLKLVTPCQGAKFVLHEYLVYKMYNLITPMSFKVRLVKIVFQDTEKNKTSDPYYGFVIEDEKQMAKRNQSASLKKIGLRPANIQKENFLEMAIFEYMIGNTDWSVEFQQNIKLIKNDSSNRPIAIPYDFDHAGIVSTPYAEPAAELKLRSTQHRRYRGYCITDMNQFTEAIKTFNELKSEFYALYESNPLLRKSYRKNTLYFLDEFYETINDPIKAQKAFSYPCDKSGTGNVIIRGLKKNK